jgi:hypothetical protein
LTKLNTVWAAVAALCVTACIESETPAADSTDDATMQAATDGAASQPTLDANVDGETSPPDQGPTPDAATVVDAGAVEPDPCAASCEALTVCALAVCPGLAEADEPALSAGCLEACDPGFSAAVDALACADAVDFARRLVAPLAQMCPERHVPAPDGGLCPYECGEDEVCSEQRCVRRDGTCDTDYHCVAGQETCDDGWCRPVQFARCEDDFACNRPTQSCRRWGVAEGPGYCVVDCAEHTDCPQNERCVDDGQVAPYCYFVFCGGESGNGETFGPCVLDAAGTEGVCYPLAAGSQQPGGATGLCAEGGAVSEGAECDAQSPDLAGQCVAGSFCFGDPDDPFSPTGPGTGRGQCAALCDPVAGRCETGTCVDFSTPDEVRTPQFDETQALGMCLNANCDVLDPALACPDGQACRIYALTDSRGTCGSAGALPVGALCEINEDCGVNALCANDGARGKRCLALCSEGEVCGMGQTCYRDPAWPLGACLTL